MKKSLFLIIPALITCFAGCKEKEEQSDVICTGDKCDPINSFSGNLKSFYLKVGETKDLKISIEGTSSIPDYQKHFTWKTTNKNIASIDVVEKDSSKPNLTAKVTGEQSGYAEVTATSDYLGDKYITFYIHVIDFTQGDYLWQYNSKDKTEFGYATGKTEGVASGTAKLNNYDWEFTRTPKAISVNVRTGVSDAIGFGKSTSSSSPDNSESITLTNKNTKNIKEIIIEAGSRHGVATLVATIGGEEVINSSLDAPDGNVLKFNTSGEFSSTKTGDIVLDFRNPSYDMEQHDSMAEHEYDNTYAPGAIIIRSIYIKYGN